MSVFDYLLGSYSLKLGLNFLQPARIPNTPYCAYESNRFATPLCIAVTVFDTSVFLAILHRLASDAAIKGSLRFRLLSAFKGKGLHSLSRALMQSGQLYYL